MRFQYAGPGPVEVVSGGELIRPGDVREYDAAPSWGPWDLLDGPDSEPAGPPPAEPEPGKPADPPAPQWPAVTPEGNK